MERYEAQHAMQEDGLHGIDGYRVVRGGEVVDDSFTTDHATAVELADSLNAELLEGAVARVEVLEEAIRRLVVAGPAWPVPDTVDAILSAARGGQ